MIHDAVENINTTIAAGIDYTANFYGIAKIFDLDSHKYPGVWDNEQKEWTQISLNDQYDLQIYHRLINITNEEREEFSFGARDVPNTRVYNMLMTIIFRKDYDEEELEEVLNLIPVDISLTGYAFVTVDLDVVNAIQDEIISSEFGDIPEDKHKSDFNIYQLSYTIESIIC